MCVCESVRAACVRACVRERAAVVCEDYNIMTTWLVFEVLINTFLQSDLVKRVVLILVGETDSVL